MFFRDYFFNGSFFLEKNHKIINFDKKNLCARKHWTCYMNMFEIYSVGLIWHLITSNNLCFFHLQWNTWWCGTSKETYWNKRLCDVDLKEQVWEGVVYVTIQQLQLQWISFSFGLYTKCTKYDGKCMTSCTKFFILVCWIRNLVIFLVLKYSN